MVKTLVLILLALWTVTGRADDVTPGLGQPLSLDTLSLYAITVFPDGRGLPAGQGSVAEGRVLYHQQCAFCHGNTGVEGPAARLAGQDGLISLRDPLRPLRIRKYPILVLSVGMWPHATTLFDYTRRAMPHYAPKSLSDDEVYALAAYLLHLNGLLDKTATMNAESLPQVVMPGRQRAVMGEAWQLAERGLPPPSAAQQGE
ncbi:MAG: cytochrome c [Marinobacter sp.]|nr:cytochrome c [Marinobacter sp.]